MKLLVLTSRAAAACGAVLLHLGAIAAAPADFPAKPVRLVVPYRAGGSSDTVARLLSQRLTDLWGERVFVDNVPGTATTYGTRQVAGAPADGHTLLAANAALAINEAISRKLPYHALRDFTPIALVARQHMGLVVNAGSAFQSVAQLLETARAKPAQVTYGSGGYGSVGHLAGELLKHVTGAHLTHVEYHGTRAALRELGSNHVTCALVALPATMPHVRSGRLRVLAVAGSDRAPVLPNVPTLGETVAGFEVNNWSGILAPYGVDVRLVRRINADVNTVISRPDWKELITSLGYQAYATTPGEFQSRLAADIERYSRIVATAGIGMP